MICGPPGVAGEALDDHEYTLTLLELVRSLDGKTPKRVIVVPNRIVNVVD